MIGKKHKLGNHRGIERSRIWIENAKAAEFGFTPGSVFVCEQEGEDFVLRLVLLEDDDIVRSRFRKHDNYGNWDDYFGLEHPQVSGMGNKKHTARAHHDKPVKIYG